MNVDGACLCGAITYEAEIDPAKIIICHCTDCQVNGGGAFRWGTVIAKADFALRTGTLKFFHKVAESGNRRALAFCGDCGTSLYGTQADQSTTLSLRLSTTRQAGKLSPAIQIWGRSRVDWLDQLDTIPMADQQPATIGQE